MATFTNGDLETDGFECDNDDEAYGHAAIDELKNQQSLLLQEMHDDVEDGFDDVAPLQEDQDAGTPNATIIMPGLQPFDRGKKGVPSSWSNATTSGDSALCLMSLTKQSWEFQSILTEFKDAGLTVKTIERIENRDLWEKFEFEEMRMKKKTAVVNEVYLFHGSKASKEQICHEGLDQRLSRIGYFGRGIYFSNDPRKCVSYTESEEQSLRYQFTTCTVYKCRVLLGNMKVYPPGESDKHLKREPLLENPEPGGLKYHDSVKGHVSQYDEYVIYKSERVMPEYVISCFMPSAPATDEAPAIGQFASTSANRDLYGGLDEDEIAAELRAESAKKTQKTGASKGNSFVEGWNSNLDEDEISAELKADALLASQLGDEEAHPELEQEEAMSQGFHQVPRHQEATLAELRQSDRHWEIAMEEQHHHPQEVPPEVRIPEERKDISGNRPVETTETDLGVVINCLDEAGQKAGKTGIRPGSARHSYPDAHPLHQNSNSAWGSPSDEEHQRQLEAVRSQMKANQPSKSAGESWELTTESPKTDVTVNALEERAGYRKEAIDPEFLPTILEVRERVRRARLLENQNKDSEAKKKKSSPSPSSRAQTKLCKEPDPSAWSPDEFAKHQVLLENIRVKVQADRRREAQGRQKKPRVAGNPDQQDITDNFASSSLAEGDDGMHELLDTLIVQFMDFTACEEIEEAREYVMKASMDVNKAIVNYLNG